LSKLSPELCFQTKRHK